MPYHWLHEENGSSRVKVGGLEVRTQGIALAVLQDLYHYLMTVSWSWPFAVLAAFFLVFDFLLKCLYYLKPGSVANLSPPGFAGAFFFSAETLATGGWGEMHPYSLYGHIVSMVEVFGRTHDAGARHRPHVCALLEAPEPVSCSPRWLRWYDRWTVGSHSCSGLGVRS